MTSSRQLSVRTFRCWTILAIVWLIRGIDHIDSFYKWFKHGLPTDAIDYATAIRFVCFVIAILILARQYQHKKEESNARRSV